MLHNLDTSQNIYDRSVPVSVIQSVIQDLDVSCKWRELVAKAGDDNQLFAFRPETVEECARESYKLQGSPASLVLTKYSNAGMTVGHLQKYLDELRMERSLKMIKMPESLYIVENPVPILKADEGDTITLSCKAAGFPYPRYVWFKENKQLTDSREKGVLKIECASPDDSGIYICRVHNDEVLRQKDQLQWSSQCEVSIRTQLSPLSCTARLTTGLGMPEPPSLPVCKQDEFGSLKIHTQPTSVQVKMLEDVFLMCSASGDPSITYQWFRNSEPIPGQNGPQLLIPKVTLINAGTYHCAVQGRWEKLRSQEAYVTVNPRNQHIHSLVPLIYEEPKDVTTQIGGMAMIEVKSQGQPLEYQWYHNNKPMIGRRHPDLAFRVDSVEDAGTYQCRVENKHGSVLSRQAVLTVDRTVHRYKAKDKVALLIGNSVHRCQQQLAGVIHDIAEAVATFRKMGFKVISLLDLTLGEMKTALRYFCSLLDEGVYCVFYFAGHGFAHHGQHYCIPWDLSHGSINREDCLCAEFVETEVQKCKPALFFMMLDICRKEDCCSYPAEPKEKRHNPTVHGNTVIWFAASYSQKAFEEPKTPQSKDPLSGHRGVPRGRFSRHVLKVLGRDKSLLDLFTDFMSEFNKDEYSQEQFPQNPEMRTNLKELHRRLTDPIDCAGHTQEIDKRSIRFESGSFVPPDRDVNMTGCGGVRLRLSFVAYMSNVLDIHISWLEAGLCENLSVHIQKTDDMAALTIENFLDKIRIKDLQRLETETLVAKIIVTLTLKCNPAISPQKQVIKAEVVLDLGRPIISSLSIWSHAPAIIRTASNKQPTQQEEEDTSLLESDA